MSDPTPRRPRFLASIPEVPTAAPLRLARAGDGAPPPPARPAHAPAARHAGPLAPEAPAAAVRAGPDLAELRREALARVADAVETLRAQSAQLAEQARADALEIGFVVARAILDAEIRQNPQALFGLVRAAVRRAGESRRIEVRLCPEDAALVQAEGRGALEATATARVELVPDVRLSRGDVVVDTDFGRVDGRLETRLAELRRAVAADAESDASREGAA